MKTTNTTPVTPECKKGRFGYRPLFKKPNETILKAFTGWCKSKLMGKAGTINPSMAEGYSTFDSAGLLCPAYQPVAGKHIHLSISSLFNL